MDPNQFYNVKYGPDGKPIWPENDPFGNRWALFGAYEGPKNYDWIWDIPDDVGDDWEDLQPEEEGVGLHPSQLPMLESPLLRDIQFVRQLGAGDYGIVYQITALYLVEDRPPFWRRFHFALKVFHLEGPDSYQIDNTLSDMRVLRYLRHENICNMADIIGIPDQTTGFTFAAVCMAMELCDRDLEGLVEDLRNTGWEPNDLFNRHWFAQAVRGLAYLHNQGYLHNDLYARNIFVKFGDPTLNNLEEWFMSSLVKLRDFGVAKDLSTLDPDERQLELKWDIKHLGEIVEDYFDYESELLDQMIDKMTGDSTKRLTAVELMAYDWLQANTGPRTEPYIWRPTGYTESRFDPFTQNWGSRRQKEGPIEFAPL